MIYPPAVPLAEEPRPVITEQRTHPASQLSTSSSSCLEIIRHNFKSQGLSQEAADVASRSRRKSTIATYDSRLSKFRDWCSRHGVSHTTATLTEIATFLNSLFDEVKQPSTIKNYRSARSVQDGSTLGTNQAIAYLLRGMHLSRPPVRLLAPS